MASPAEKTLADGTIRYLARWREGGRGGTQHTVPFDDSRTRDRFIYLVNAAGNQWPDDNTLARKGFGYLIKQQSRAMAPGDPIPLVVYVRHFISTLDNAHRETRNKYNRYVDYYLEPFFERMDIRSITRHDLREWQRWMMTELELSAKTVCNVRGTVLAPVFKRAMMRGDRNEEELLEYSPLHGLDAPKKTKHFRQILQTPEHAAILFRAAYEFDADAADLIYILANLANRWGEMAALHDTSCVFNGKRSYVEVRHKAVHLSGEGWVIEPGAKTAAGAYRRIPVDERVGRVLARRCASRRGLLFPHPSGLLWPHGQFYRTRWQPIVELARSRGLPYDLTLHGLRKTTISVAIDGGTSVVAIAAIAGHEDPAFTLREYTTPMEGGRTAFADAMGEFYPEDVHPAA